MTTSPTRTAPHPNSRQARLREKAEEINLVLLEPDVDLWKLRELALSDGGLVNDTIRRRAWPKLVGLSSYNNNPDDIKVISVGSGQTKPNGTTNNVNNTKSLRKGTAPHRVTNFGHGENQPGTALTGGIFDQHDTAAVQQDTAATAALQEDDTTSLASFDSIEPSEVVACMDAEQIDRDVTRCTWHLLTGGQRTRRRVMLNKHRKKISKILRRKQRRLGDLINLTLALSENELPLTDRLCYFQGYHDVASIFLSSLGGASTKLIERHQHQPSIGSATASTAAFQAASMGLELSARVLYQVSLSHFREPMRSNFMNLQTALRMVILPLLRVVDPEIHAHLYGCGMEPFFALSWCLTLFSHDIRDTVLVKRLFDFFLVSHPLMPMYLSVAMMCHPSNRQEILATPCEFAELHNVLQGLPKNSSMVGWKWSVGVDGYVSDDDQVGEDGETSISLDSDMASHQSTRGPSLISGNDGMMRRNDLVLSEGQAHVVTMAAHVPFQELIDSAIAMIGRAPPRKLRKIALRYYGEQQSEPMLKMYPSITLFQNPPNWALVATAKADWVLKQRARERYGLSPTSRKDRRALTDLLNRNNAAGSRRDLQQALSNDGDDDVGPMSDAKTSTPEEIGREAKLLNWPKAMVAQGFGQGEDEVAKQNKRRKLARIGGAATVAIFAVALGIAIQYRQSTPTPVQQASEKGTGSNFTLDRDEAVSYVKSAKVPVPVPVPESTRKVSRPSPELTSTKLSAVEPGSCPDTVVAKQVGESSSITSFLQKQIVREIQIVYAKFRLLMKALKDPAFLSHVTQKIASVQDAEVRAAIQRSIAKRAVQALQFVRNGFRFTARQAREHLGDNNLENLELL